MVFTASSVSFAAVPPPTFGKIVTVAGHLADIALDQKRRVVYAASFTRNRVEVISMDTQTLLAPIVVGFQPSTLAISPDGRYLMVGHYSPIGNTSSIGIKIIDLESNAQQTVYLGGTSVLAVNFGKASKALVILKDGIKLVEAKDGTVTPVSLKVPASTSPLAVLPVPWATVPSQTIEASSGVSGDGEVIYAIVSLSSPTANYVVRYEVGSGALTAPSLTTDPTLGPVVISVDRTGQNFLAGWVLANEDLTGLTEFPYPSGTPNVGGHAFDWKHRRIYAQVSTEVGPNLHVVDADNLTVREVFRLR